MDGERATAATAGSRTDLVSFFEAVYESFLRAERSSHARSERFFRIAGKIVRLRFGGAALPSAVTPAMEHLAADPAAEPDLTVCLWDILSTGATLPRAPWSGQVYGPRGEVVGYSDHRIRTAYTAGAGALSMFDAARKLAVYCTRDASGLPTYEKGAPLRTILHWALREHSLQLSHAAAVGLAEGGVLLAGKSGSGKSTTALSCLQSDLLYASDDYCVLEGAQPPYVHSIYSTAKVNADNISRVDFLKSAISNPDRLGAQKALMFLQSAYPEKVTPGFPIRAVLLPRTTGRLETTVTPASSSEALGALAVSTMRQLAGADHQSLRMMSRITDCVPCFHLELGTDLPRIPGVILEVIRQSGQGD